MGVFAVCACYWTWTDSLRFFWIIEKKLPNSCLKTRVQHFEVYVGRHSRLTPLVCFHKCFCPEFLPSDQGCSCVPDVVACFMEADHHVTQYYRSHRDVKIAHTYTLFVLLWTILHLIYSRYSSSSSYKKVKGSRPNWFELDKWIRPFKERTYARIWWFLFVTSEPPHPPKKKPKSATPPPKKEKSEQTWTATWGFGKHHSPGLQWVQDFVVLPEGQKFEAQLVLSADMSQGKSFDPI